jgi:Zn-finger nucleic acid-binding protein
MQTPCNFREKTHALKRMRSGLFRVAALAFLLLSLSSITWADQLRLADGTLMEVDAAWEDAQGIWYRRGGVTHLVERARVRAIERADSKTVGKRADELKSKGAKAQVKTVEGETATSAETTPTVWIYLVGGAKMEVDEATENAEGVWYRRGNLSIFIERSRIERVEREQPVELIAGADNAASKRARRERFWTTGSLRLDALIKQHGSAYSVDPYLIFCVMEQESHFNSRAASPKGARGLMQLMPGTAARFGVTNSHDPSQNIRGGTRYLKQLLQRFGGRVDLVLASYNAGEGAVMKYGHRVPPYRETRNYVQRISARYMRGM